MSTSSVTAAPMSELGVDTVASGSGEELLAWAGIDADHIAAAARRLLDRATGAPA